MSVESFDNSQVHFQSSDYLNVNENESGMVRLNTTSEMNDLNEMEEDVMTHRSFTSS